MNSNFRRKSNRMNNPLGTCKSAFCPIISFYTGHFGGSTCISRCQMQIYEDHFHVGQPHISSPASAYRSQRYKQNWWIRESRFSDVNLLLFRKLKQKRGTCEQENLGLDLNNCSNKSCNVYYLFCLISLTFGNSISIPSVWDIHQF